MYNTYHFFNEYLIGKGYSGMIDLKPSVIKSRKIPQSLVMLINPTLMSIEMINNFKSVCWVIENVTTYYFENFLTVPEWGMITKELGSLWNEAFWIDNLTFLNFKQYFASQKHFNNFFKYLGLEKYIDSTRVTELR